MKILASHRIYNENTLKPVVFPVGGLHRSDYNERDELENLRAKGYPWRVYVLPDGYNADLHNLDGVIVLH